MLRIAFRPRPAAAGFTHKVLVQSRESIEVRIAVLDATESREFFGVPLARRGIQPIWVQVINRSDLPQRLQFVAIDPNYFSPLEAAAACHYSGVRRWFEFGLLAWLFLPLLVLLPIRLWSVRRANQQMDDFFQQHAFRMRPTPAGGEQSGFVFANATQGNRVVLVRLLSYDGPRDFEFMAPAATLDADHLRRDLANAATIGEAREVDLKGLRDYLEAAPAATSNAAGRKSGDPVNLAIIGDFAAVLTAFGARWDETEAISLASCWKTALAFLRGSEYRYSPVSSLYLFGRSQDFALQRIRNSINERLHLRLWATPIAFRGRPVWIGQVSRDIGVRLTWKTWNLTTHRIDPDVDEARDHVSEDLLHLERVDVGGYVGGAPACGPENPQRNLTGDPYYSDGKRAVVLLADARTAPQFIAFA